MSASVKLTAAQRLDEAIAVAQASGANVANDVGFARRLPGSSYFRPAPNGRDDSPSSVDVERAIADLNVRARIAARHAALAASKKGVK
jgi:hypothetical protein